MITLVIHPIDTQRHSTVPPGWRWAIMAGDDLSDMSRCANAGWCPSQLEAELEGQMVAATVVKALRFFGHRVDYERTLLAHDPIPADAPTGLPV